MVPWGTNRAQKMEWGTKDGMEQERRNGAQKTKRRVNGKDVWVRNASLNCFSIIVFLYPTTNFEAMNLHSFSFVIIP